MLTEGTSAVETATTGAEKRFSPRYPVRVPIVFSGDLVNGKGIVFNLSSSGCGVKTASRMKHGLYVHLLLRLPQERVPLKVELAAVRWADQSLCGIEFIRMSDQQQQRLRGYLRLVQMAPGR